MNCSTCKNKGVPKGCKGNGSCLTNGCNQRSVYNWLSDFDTLQPAQQNVVELSFKNGRKDFGLNSNKLPLQVGDLVLISASHGKDMGTVSLTGELVQFQIRRKKAEKIFNRFPEIIRKADKEDIMSWKKIREKEDDYMLKARIIASDLGLIMKISDAEIQADGKKITFYYTADKRVDFRNLLKKWIEDFSIKVEMKQVGHRQESARLGGIGSCGRELCCSTWMTDFRSVTTKAARYQQLALNPQKLAGQCGKLKCCLNFELDQYVEILNTFPSAKRKLISKTEKAIHVKTDVFRKMMWYVIKNQDTKTSNMVNFHVDEVKALHKKMDEGEAVNKLKNMEFDSASNEHSSSILSDDINRFNKRFKKRNGSKKRKK